MMGLAISGLVLVVAAWLASVIIAYRYGGRDALDRYKAEQLERRSLRRIEARAATLGPHRLSPWPGPDPADQLATTDQLRKLAYEGDIPEIKRQVAAFGRVHALKRWIGAA